MTGFAILILVLYLLVTGVSYWLEFLNYKHLLAVGDEVPPEFSTSIDQKTLEKTRDYTVEKMRFGWISGLFSEILMIVFIFGGLLNLYNNWIASWKLPFVVQGILFFLIITYVKTFLSLPFSLYSTFKIEKKYGFNTMTIQLWLVDLIKSLVISTIMLGILLAVSLSIVKALPTLWWLPVWGFFLIFTLFVMYVSPYVLEPLFNKFTPVEDENLISEIKRVMSGIGISISKIFKMDASKRTKHSNAYFSGFGKVKRIVLFDTLLEQMSQDEIVAVLAHEGGHWKRKHVIKLIVVTEVMAFVGIIAAFVVMRSDFLSVSFGLDHNTFFAKLVILSVIASIAMFPFSPIFNVLSRKFEREADDMAVSLVGGGESLASALVKLTKENLSNLHPHPWYAFFHYSHPPAVERVRYLRKK